MTARTLENRPTYSTRLTARTDGPDAPYPGGIDRGVSPVVGAILMFALAISLLALLQLTAVPALNEEAEFQHNERVQDEMLGVDATVQEVGATGTARTTSVEAGLQYSPRMFFVNPPPVAGTVRTTDASGVGIDNARATGEPGDYWDGERRTFETRSLEYVPDYNEYAGAPETVYEPWAVYNRYEETTHALTEQDLIDDRRIGLVALKGDHVDSNPGAVPLRVEPTSAPARTVTVSDDGEPITLTVPTGLTENEWEDLLEDELDPAADPDNDRYVTALECRQSPPEPCGELTITLQRDETYELALGAVGLGSDTPENDAAYLADVEGDQTSIPEGGRQRLVVDARDRFDNPVSGVTLESTVDGDGIVRTVDPVTDAEGRATFVYDAPGSVDGYQDVEITLAFGDEHPRQRATYDVRVMERAGSSPGAAPSAVIADVDPNTAGNTDRYTVTVDATAPDGNLESIEYELQVLETGTVLDATSASVDGETDTASEPLRAQGDERHQEYRIVATVVTADGATDRTETTVAGTGS